MIEKQKEVKIKHRRSISENRDRVKKVKEDISQVNVITGEHFEENEKRCRKKEKGGSRQKSQNDSEIKYQKSDIEEGKDQIENEDLCLFGYQVKSKGSKRSNISLELNENDIPKFESINNYHKSKVVENKKVKRRSRRL